MNKITFFESIFFIWKRGVKYLTLIYCVYNMVETPINVTESFQIYQKLKKNNKNIKYERWTIHLCVQSV